MGAARLTGSPRRRASHERLGPGARPPRPRPGQDGPVLPVRRTGPGGGLAGRVHRRSPDHHAAQERRERNAVNDDFEARREALTTQHGQGRHYPEATALRLLGGAGAGLNVHEAIAWLYPTREAAHAWHPPNTDPPGHPTPPLHTPPHAA